MRSLNVLNKLLTATIIFTMINLNIAINIEQARFNITGQQAMAQSTLPKEDRSMSGDGSFKLKNAQESDSDSMARKRQQNSGTYTKEKASGGLLGIFSNQLFAPLILLTIAFLVAKIWLFFKPSKPYDVYAAALGAGILLLNEVMSAFKQNESLKDRKDRIEYEGLDEDGQIDVSQKQMLEEEKAALEEIKGTAENKSKYQKAAAAAFAVASGIAFVQGNGEQIQAQACAAAVNARAKALMALQAGSVACMDPSAADTAVYTTACEATAVTTEAIETLKLIPGESKIQYAQLMSLIETKETNKQTCKLGADAKATQATTLCKGNLAKAQSATPVSAALTAKLSVALGEIQAATGALAGTKAVVETACLVHTEETVKNSGESSEVKTGADAKPSVKAGFYASILTLLINKAHAGYGNLIGALGGLIAAYKLPVGTAMDTFMLSSTKRGTLWLAMSGTSLASSKAMDKEADTIQKNIDKIDSILKKFRSADSVTSAQAKTLQKKTTMLSAYTPQQIGEKFECIGGLPKIATNNGSKACPNAKKYIVSGTDKLNAAGFKMPDSLVGSLVNAANGIQDTTSISPTTQEAFDALGSSANALNKKANAVMKKTLERAQKANKKKPVAKNLLASFGRKFGNLNKRAGGSSGLMSALPYLSQPNQGSRFDENEDEEELQDGLAVDAKGGEGLDAAGAANNGGFKFDFGESDADQYALHKNSEFAANADAVAAMEEDSEGEIIEDSNVDIWKAISVRYKKTAYDRLLKRIE
ncbi:hypothetical protein M902_2004 [Bacteriovorax sp. BAL6_X]|uniref:hypothetical protein n=1 Tax=Bacteriovorax sp. BAL6_X TaxID=1201290 RepID=UPI000386B579|nr:hypothetical protein [Bacteriovorax sp. BAL6_X]EPZ52046.1 hypothetical protein M902_2004 [Bacteriovorax sp. BAL6_X]